MSTGLEGGDAKAGTADCGADAIAVGGKDMGGEMMSRSRQIITPMDAGTESFMDDGIKAVQSPSPHLTAMRVGNGLMFSLLCSTFYLQSETKTRTLTSSILPDFRQYPMPCLPEHTVPSCLQCSRQTSGAARSFDDLVPPSRLDQAKGKSLKPFT